MARLMITWPDELLEQMDQAARAEQRSRSEFVREAVQYYLKKSSSPHQPGSTLGSVGVIGRLRMHTILRKLYAAFGKPAERRLIRRIVPLSFVYDLTRLHT